MKSSQLVLRLHIIRTVTKHVRRVTLATRLALIVIHFPLLPVQVTAWLVLRKFAPCFERDIIIFECIIEFGCRFIVTVIKHLPTKRWQHPWHPIGSPMQTNHPIKCSNHLGPSITSTSRRSRMLVTRVIVWLTADTKIDWDAYMSQVHCHLYSHTILMLLIFQSCIIYLLMLFRVVIRIYTTLVWQ